MTFPLAIFLYFYFVFLIFWLVFSFIALYHILRFVRLNFTSFFAILLFISVSAVIFNYSYFYLSRIDWGLNVSILPGVSANWFELNF